MISRRALVTGTARRWRTAAAALVLVVSLGTLGCGAIQVEAHQARSPAAATDGSTRAAGSTPGSDNGRASRPAAGTSTTTSRTATSRTVTFFPTVRAAGSPSPSANLVLLPVVTVEPVTSAPTDDPTAGSTDVPANPDSVAVSDPAVPAVPVAESGSDVGPERRAPASSGQWGWNIGCDVQPVTPADGLDAFYAKRCEVGGILIVASAGVDSRALGMAAATVAAVLAPRPDLMAELVRRRLHVGVIGVHERAVDLPEYRDLPRLFPAVNWQAARAYSATEARPLLTAPEENLVCSVANTYPDQQVLVHELGHSILDLAVRNLDPSFWGRVEQAYGAASGTGRWLGFYGGTSAGEYWAEGAQAYFDASHASAGPDVYGSPVGSRAELAAYDPALFDLVSEVFATNPWRAACP
jgi:hypothetical protein